MMEVKHLELYGIIKSSQLRGICKFTPNLETLSVDFLDGISDGSMFDWMASLTPKLKSVVLEETQDVSMFAFYGLFESRHDIFHDLVISIGQCNRLVMLKLSIAIPYNPYCELRTIFLPYL